MNNKHKYLKYKKKYLDLQDNIKHGGKKNNEIDIYLNIEYKNLPKIGRFLKIEKT